MKMGTLQRLARKAIAVLLSAAVILTAPGLSSYQAVASEFRAGKEGKSSRKAKVPPQIKPVEGLSVPLSGFRAPAPPIAHAAAPSLPIPAAPAGDNAPAPQTLFGRLKGAAARAQSLWNPEAPASELKVKAAEAFDENLSKRSAGAAAPIAVPIGAKPSWAKRLSLSALSPAALAAPALAKAVPAAGAVHSAAVSSGALAYGPALTQAVVALAAAPILLKTVTRLLNWDPAAEPSAKNTAIAAAVTVALTPALLHIIPTALTATQAVVSAGLLLAGLRLFKKPASREPAPPMEPHAAPQAKASAPSAAPKGFDKLPAEARGTGAAELMKAKAAAQARARRVAKDAQLVRVTINLDGPQAHWTFVFQSKSKKKILTVWQKNIGVKNLPKGSAEPVLWDSRLAKLSGLAEAYAALKADKARFKPVRVEIVAAWKGDPSYLFTDARGKEARVPGASQAAPAPAAAAPSAARAPPAQAPQSPAAQPAVIPSVKVRISEDYFGFRWQRGALHDPALSRFLFSAATPQIIDRISRQWPTLRNEIFAAAKEGGLSERSPAKDWFAFYDRLQNASEGLRKAADHGKHEGAAEVADYQGWKKFVRPAVKGFFGAFGRFPYGLFDSFALSGFRLNGSFALFHSNEDYLSSAEPARLKQTLAAIGAEQKRNGAGKFGGVLQTPAGRAAKLVLHLTVEPLAGVAWRRVTMAIMSKIVLGLLGAAAVHLTVFGFPILAFSITSIPILGNILVGAAHALPYAVDLVPGVGHFFSPVVQAVTTSLIEEMKLGRLIQTYVLSFFLQLTNQVSLRDPKSFKNVPAALASKAFWKGVNKSFVSMSLVGAEIGGILAYLGGIDWLADSIAMKLTGHHFVSFKSLGFFRAFGTAIEGGKDDSILPTGGVISWGNTIVDMTGKVFGVDLADGVMHALDFSHKTAGMSAQTAVGLASHMPGEPNYEFDPDIYKKSPAEAAVRIKELAGLAGGLGKEIAAVRDHRAGLLKELAAASQKIAELQKKGSRVTPGERQELARLKAELKSRRDDNYDQAKFSQGHDARNPRERTARLEELKKLEQSFNDILAPKPGDKAGQADNLSVRAASLKALAQRLADFQNPGGSGGGKGPGSQVDQKLVEAISKQVDEIEKGRADVQLEMQTRDAARQLLAVANKARNDSLKARRDGKGELGLKEKMSRWHAAVDFSYVFNVITTGLGLTDQLIDLNNQKLAKITAAGAANNATLVQANNGLDQTAHNNQTISEQIAKDKVSQKDMETLGDEAGNAIKHISAFQSGLPVTIGKIGAGYQGFHSESGDAAAEFQRRLDLLPKVVQWRTKGNPATKDAPNDPNAINMEEIKSNLAEVDSNLVTLTDGLKTLSETDPGNWGPIMNAAPGGDPDDPNSNKLPKNPSYDDLLNNIAKHKVYWQGKLAEEQKQLDSIARMLGNVDSQGVGPGPSIKDEFGDTHPESLPAWKALAQDEEAAARALYELDVQGDATHKGLNQLAAEVNMIMSGLDPHFQPIPMLPVDAQSLASLPDILKSYAATLKGISIPDKDDPNVHTAQLDLVDMAKLLPDAAWQVIVWSRDDAIITQIDDAMTNTLPVVQTKLGGVVQMLKDVVADADTDTAVVTAVKTLGGGVDTGMLMQRKTALLNEIKGALQGAQSLLADNGPLQTFQQKSIDSAQPTAANDLYKLFDGEKTLLNDTVQLYNQTLPWALAAHGAPYGNAGAANASIDSWEARLNKNKTGYDDAQGHHEGLQEAQDEITRRKDPNYAATEHDGEGGDQTPYLQDPNYPGGGPYSLPRKIALYAGEMAQRAQEINARNTQVNQILDKLAPLLNGKYGDLSQMHLPTDISVDNPKQVEDLVGRNGGPNRLQTLGDLLTRIGNEAAQNATGIDMGDPNDTTIPVGRQPDPTIDNYSKEALLALQSGIRIAGGSLTTPQNPSSAYSVARFLYANGVIESANEALAPGGKLDQAQDFVTMGMTAIGHAVSAAEQDRAYINSVAASPNSETAQTAAAVYARQLAVFGELQEFLAEGVSFFKNKKLQWDQDSFDTVDKVNTYYNALKDISSGASNVNTSEIEAWQRINDGLMSKKRDLEEKRAKVLDYLSQLQNKAIGQDKSQDSALREVADQISSIQDQTRAVLKDNSLYRDLQRELSRSDDILKADLGRLDEKQGALADTLEKLVKDPSSRGKLTPQLVERLEKLRVDRGMWAMGNGESGAAPQSIVIRKSEFSSFLDTMLRAMNPQGSVGKMDLIKQDLLNNPQNLSALMPGAQLLDFTETADGFYMVYQSQFGVPHGLETKNWATLGNLFNVGGSNVSVIGYQFASPPAGNNAPYGDKGIEVQIESLGHDHWVNYLNIDFHRYALDIPPDTTIESQVRESRVMLFDDYAVMLFGDKLYLGVAAVGDMSSTDLNPNRAPQRPYFYGGNLQSSMKLTEVMSLNTKQQQLFSKDPRTFMQQVNLDFTGFDKDYNQTLTGVATGRDMRYWRSEIGPSFNIARLIDSIRGADAKDSQSFTMDLFFANSGGTEDVTQKSAGARILKGFTLRDNSGKPWAQISNTASGELGQQFNTYTDRLAVTLPNQGIVLSADGKFVGTAAAIYGQVARKTGGHSEVALGYGSQYVNNADRLSLKMNTSFTLGELWQKVIDKSSDNLKGGKSLEGFNKKLDEFYKSGTDTASVKKAELLKRLWEESVARRLLSQNMGLLTADIKELRAAGSFLDKSRVQGTVGVVSRPVGTNVTDRAVGGGFVVGTNATLLSLGKTPKALLDKKIPELVAEGARLQEAIPRLTKDFESAVTALAQAQWEMKLADYMLKNAPSEALRGEAEVQAAQASARYHQALHIFNSLTFRNLEDPSPFDDFNTGDLEALRAKMRAVIAAPDRMDLILHSLDESEIMHQVGEKDPVNLMDWLPWVDKLSFSVGVQLQDLMANQQFTGDLSLQLPIWKPGSKDAAYAYRLQGDAARELRDDIFARERLAHEKEIQEARVWAADAEALRPRLPAAAADLSAKLQGYRNGLIGPRQLHEAFAAWHWYADKVMDADSRAALAEAWAATDASLGGAAPARDPQTLTISSLNDAFKLISSRSHSLKEIALRENAAKSLAQADDHRIAKAYVDLHLGTDLTAAGAGWLPAVGITGVAITPILGFEYKPEDLRILEVAKDRGEEKNYRLLKANLEVGLAVQFYQNGITYEAAREGLEDHDRLIAELAKAGAKTDVLDEARLKRSQLDLEGRRALATLNYLLGRSPDSPLEVKLNAKEGLASLNALIDQKVGEVAKDLDEGSGKGLAALQKQVLRARVDIARAHQKIVDYDLRKKNLAGEPISIGARYVGGIINTLKNGDIGDPDKMQAALNQTLTESGALERFEQNQKAQVSQARAELARAQDELARLPGNGAAESEAKRDVLTGRVYALKAGLMALGADPEAAPGREYEPAPKSFTELQNRLSRSQQDLADKPSQAELETSSLSPSQWQAAGYYRRFYARQSLGMDPIGRWYHEGWIEVRLKSSDTPPAARLKLAKLAEQRGDRIAKNELSRASTLGEMLTVDFQTNVRMMRWARSVAARSPQAARQGDFAKFVGQLEGRLNAERGRIVALLDLSPETTLEQLEAVIPDDPSGARNLRALSENFLEEIRGKRLELIHQTLFEGGLPRSFGEEDNLMHQIRADTIAQQMSYKGFTPILAMGLFRGQNILGGFMQAPDPRAIEKGLESVLSDALRQQLESTGQMQALTLHLHQLMSRVQDGAEQLEKRRALVEKAEEDYKAQIALADGDSTAGEVVAAQERVVQAWIGFADQMVQTKSDFISLVTELEALQIEKPRDLSALSAAPRFPSLRDDPTRDALSYWTDRFLDDSFGAKMDDEFAKLGSAVPEELKARVREDAEAFRTAKRDQEAVLHKDFDAALKMELLSKNDLAGKREALERDLAFVLKVLEAQPSLGDSKKPELLAFLSQDLNVQAERSALERARYAQTAQGLRDAYWRATPSPEAVDGAYARLEALKQEAEAARQNLLQGYLQNASYQPSDFILTDIQLDRYLKAQQAFDSELVKTVKTGDVQRDQSLAWGLDGLYDIRGSLSRETSAARAGRGMLALDALIMLEESRLSAARWEGRPRPEIDRVALSLQNLKDRKAGWENGAVDLLPLYKKISVVQDGQKVETVEEWLTRDHVKDLVKSGRIVKKGDRYYDKDLGDKVQIVGGVDAREADRDEALRTAEENGRVVGLHQKMKDYDFVVVDAAAGEPQGYSYDAVMGPDGLLHKDGGRLFFFQAPQADEPSGRVHKSLNPLSALRERPEESVLYVYQGKNPPARDRFPTLESLRSSGREGDFRLLVLGEKGAAKAVETAGRRQAAEQGVGWIESKLNGYGFARDENGAPIRLYQTKEAFYAEKKAFHDAESSVKSAEKELAKSQELEAKAAAEKDKRKEALDRQSAAYSAVEKKVRSEMEEKLPKSSGEGLDEARRKIELEKLVAQDKRFKNAKKELVPYSKKFSKAQDAFAHAAARRENAQSLLKSAYETRNHAKAWSLYKSDDLAVKWDGAGTILSVEASPIYGKQKLDETLAGGGGGGDAQELRGELLAVVMDNKGRIKQIYTKRSEFDKAVKGWIIKTVEIKPDQKVDESGQPLPPVEASSVADDGRVLNPAFRLSHYEVKETGDRVLLSRRFLTERAESDQSKVWRTKHAWLMPWNLGSLALELPRSLAGIPLELGTGRDPAQHHYRGRMNMLMLEGGATEHRGFFRRFAGGIDILDFMPDQVERYYDASQFPAKVKIDSPIRPGEDILSKKMRDPKTGKDIHFGVKGAQTRLTYSMEDLTTAVERTLSHFNGGVEETLVDEARGRAGTYQESVRKGASGKDAAGRAVIDKSLEDPLISNDSRSDGSADVVISATPGNLAGEGLDFGVKVDRIQKQVRIRVGAAQYGEEIDALKGYPERLAGEEKQALERQPELQKGLAQSEKDLENGVKARDRSEDAVNGAAARYHRLAWRIGAQEAIERAIARLEDRARELKAEIHGWNKYLKKVEEALASQRKPNPPAPEPIPSRGGFWTLFVLALAAALAAWKGRIAAAYARILQRRP